VIVVEIVRASAQATGGGSGTLTTNVHVLNGSALVTPINVKGASPITVGQFQTYSQIGNVVGSIRPLTSAGMTQILSNLHASPQHGQSSGGAADQITSHEQARAASIGSNMPADLSSFLPGGKGAPSGNQQSAPITPPRGSSPPPPPKTAGTPLPCQGCPKPLKN
jgi:hypothetical protein